MIFVFGSNMSGHHGAGAALAAVEHYGAFQGNGAGPQGNSYAIPTKDYDWSKSLSLQEVSWNVRKFLDYARQHPLRIFHVTRIGCGYAGFRDVQIAPLFADAPPNCLFDSKWAKHLPEKAFWGTF
jgi:hypothetical protein